MKNKTTTKQKLMLSLIADGFKVDIRCPRRTIAFGRKTYSGEKAFLYKDGEKDVVFSTKTYYSLLRRELVK